MEQSNRNLQPTNDRHVLLEQLRREQNEYGEGTSHWSLVQEKINQIVAQNLLEYVNR